MFLSECHAALHSGMTNTSLLLDLVLLTEVVKITSKQSKRKVDPNMVSK